MANGAETIDLTPGVAPRTIAGVVADDSKWMIFVALVVLNVADLITTALVIDRGGAERNPFVQPVIDSMWQIGLLKGLVLVLVATLLTRCRESRIAELSLTLTTGWYLAVVCWNVAVLTIL